LENASACEGHVTRNEEAAFEQLQSVQGFICLQMCQSNPVNQQNSLVVYIIDFPKLVRSPTDGVSLFHAQIIRPVCPFE